jgi:hypothetical protein
MNYQKMAERALKLLHKSLPALQMGNNVLFVSPVEHILRGFTLETHFDMKGAAYLWRVVMPLYRPPCFLVFNYADRLLEGEKVSLLESDLDQTIDRLARVVSQGEIEHLKRIKSPQDFLQQVDWGGRPASPNYLLDRALTQYMTGNVPACLGILGQVVSVQFSPRWAESVALARELIEELEVNLPAFDRRIRAWEERNIGWLRLAPRARRKVQSGPDAPT